MKLKNLLTSILIGFYSITIVHAQTVSDVTGGAVPPNGNYIVFNLPVSGISPSILDANYGLTDLCIDFTHPNLTEIMINLVSPSGKYI